MAVATRCQTPGAVFNTAFTNRSISCDVIFPKPFSITAEQAELIEANIHNALELVLAPLFQAEQE